MVRENVGDHLSGADESDGKNNPRIATSTQRPGKLFSATQGLSLPAGWTRKERQAGVAELVPADVS